MMRGGPLKIESLEGLHELVQRFIKAHENNDAKTQRDILRTLIEDEQECYRRKLKLLAELKTLIQEVRTAPGDAERVTRLIALFRFSADLRSIGYEELADQETGDKATQATFNAAQDLKKIGPLGVAALTDLLIDSSLAIRCAAAIHLLSVIPERAIPLLKEVEELARGSGAAVSAGFALSRYLGELERQSPPAPPPSAS